nr:hypothetical protein [Tanacetum cinerariifolium]
MNYNYFEPNPCYDSNSFGFDQPSQYTIDHQEDLNQQSMNDVDDSWNKIIESGNKIIQILGEMENTLPLNEKINSQIPPSIVITASPPVLPTEDPEVSLIMGNEELNTIPEKESDEFIKSSVEDLVPILSESKDTSGRECVCILTLCDDFSPIDISEEKAVTFSNPLFEFDDEYISNDVNSLFDEVLEDIECKEFYDPNLNNLTFLVTPIFDSNEDEYFTPGDNIGLLLHHDPMMSVDSIL